MLRALDGLSQRYPDGELFEHIVHGIELISDEIEAIRNCHRSCFTASRAAVT